MRTCPLSSAPGGGWASCDALVKPQSKQIWKASQAGKTEGSELLWDPGAFVFLVPGLPINGEAALPGMAQTKQRPGGSLLTLGFLRGWEVSGRKMPAEGLDL